MTAQQSEENETFKRQIRVQLEVKMKELRKSLIEKETVIQQIEIDKGCFYTLNNDTSLPISEPSNSLIYRDVHTISLSNDLIRL